MTTLPTIDEAKQAREAELTDTKPPSWSKDHVHSSTDRMPKRPYTVTLPNGTVIVHN